jgi:SpoVK/Ycf46/Vps4 family AAA+-type ATPase
VIGSELVQKYVGEGARMVRELFAMARSKKACIIFFDEIDAIGGARGDDASGDNEVQRTMLEIVNQLDGFDARGNIKVRDGWGGSVVVGLGGFGGGLLGTLVAAFVLYCSDRCYSLFNNSLLQ